MTDLKHLSRASRGQDQNNKDGGEGSASVPRPPRRWLTRLALPGAVVLAVALLLAYAARDVLLPAREVSVVRAVALQEQASADDDGAATPQSAPASAATVVAQAPGWVEPDPYPIYVAALADGIVDKVHVLEGQPVEAGQVLVELVDEDAALALEQARAAYAQRRAELTAAQTDFDEPVALTRAAAVGRARLAEAKAALARLDAEVVKEQAKLAELEAAYERVASLTGGSVSALQVDAAKYQAQSQRAVVEATRQRRPVLEAQVAAARAELAAAERDLELKTALRKARDQAAAALDAAQAAVEEAELRLRRMTLVSPADGVVMNRLVAPGSKLVIGMDDKHSIHAIHLYKPGELQVRVDVPLSDAAAVGVGQRAVVVVDVLPNQEFTGEVTRIVNRADIAKNTVQFKVALDEPSALLKPDMLARVKFLSGGGASQGGSGGSGGGGSAQAGASGGGGPVVIQRSAVVDGAEGTYVWWVSPVDQRIERRPVTLGADRGEGLVAVRRGLNPGDVLVDQPDASLTEGERVRYGGVTE